MPETPGGEPSQALAVFGLQQGPGEGEALAVRSPVATIGQGPQNDVVLEDDSVSRAHARLEYVDGGWRLTDLGSINGTAIDGVRLEPQRPGAARARGDGALRGRERALPARGPGGRGGRAGALRPTRGGDPRRPSGGGSASRSGRCSCCWS